MTIVLPAAVVDRLNTLPRSHGPAPLGGMPFISDPLMPANRGLILDREGRVLKVIIFEDIPEAPAAVDSADK